MFIFSICFVHASSQEYIEKADKLKLSQERYWQLLLHMKDGTSEIDDARFFFASNGKNDAKSELHATIEAIINETRFDDNASACKFPARTAWLTEELNITDLPEVTCSEYEETLKKLDPKSATLVFPSAHINSPASMFGHTFLRINSSYESRLLSYAINYAADANPDDTNAVIFAIKGLFGGYYGKYSLLPYYEKLKEYRDTEQRDIWEYDLDLSETEVLKMVRHIWELNGTHSDYYFFTENCSYNMLWLIELARPSIHLREYFHYDVIPLETVHAAKLEHIIEKDHYRPSKRTILLKYEDLIQEKYIHMPKDLLTSKVTLQDFLDNTAIDIQQKRYILEASIEYLEYSFSKNTMDKKKYLKLFHNLSKERASLGKGEKLHIKVPPNPIESHRAVRLTLGGGVREDTGSMFLGIRPAYHDIEDSSYGFLRGTQIEFLDFLASYTDNSLEVENLSIISIVSLAQRTEFFDSLSWRTKFGWDKNYLDNNTNFIGSVGVGYSWGNEFAYIYMMADPLFYHSKDGFVSALGASAGVVIDKYSFMNTNLEATRRFYDDGSKQTLIHASQNFRTSQNTQLSFKYDFKGRKHLGLGSKEESYQAVLHYYF